MDAEHNGQDWLRSLGLAAERLSSASTAQQQKIELSDGSQLSEDNPASFTSQNNGGGNSHPFTNDEGTVAMLLDMFLAQPQLQATGHPPHLDPTVVKRLTGTAMELTSTASDDTDERISTSDLVASTTTGTANNDAASHLPTLNLASLQNVDHATLKAAAATSLSSSPFRANQAAGASASVNLPQRRLSIALAHAQATACRAATAASLNSGTGRTLSSLPSSASTESLSGLDGLNSPIATSASITAEYWSLQAQNRRRSLLQYGYEPSASASTQSTVSFPSPVDQPLTLLTFDNQPQHISDSHLQQQFDTSYPPPFMRDRSNSSHDVALFLSQGLSHQIVASGQNEAKPEPLMTSFYTQAYEQSSSATPSAAPPRNNSQQHRRAPQHQTAQQAQPPPPSSPSKRQRVFRDLTDSPVPSNGGGGGGSSGSKSYPCTFPGCNKVFPRAYNLKSHSYCHSGERPHKCNACTATFSRKHDLQRHTRTLHAKERPHVCMFCQQGFMSLEQLRRHAVSERHHPNLAPQPPRMASNASTQSSSARQDIRSVRRASTSTSSSNGSSSAEHSQPSAGLANMHLSSATLYDPSVSEPYPPSSSTSSAAALASAAVAADWTMQQQQPNLTHLHPTFSTTDANSAIYSGSVQDRYEVRRSSAVEFADGTFPGMPDPESLRIPGIDEASVRSALRKRRASGTTGNAIGVLALAAEAEVKRQMMVQRQGGVTVGDVQEGKDGNANDSEYVVS